MKISLVLEGGGMRGLYTCGVLDFFLEKDLTFDMVVGVSAGACAACSFLSKQYRRGADININYAKDKRFLSVQSLLKTGSAFGIDFIFDTIPNNLNLYDYKTFHNNPTKFYSVATDIVTGKAVYKRIIDMRNDIGYLKATMSIPLLSPVVEVDQYKLLDGGVADSVPVDFGRNKGYQKQVVVLTQPRDYQKGKNNLMPMIAYNYKQYPKLVEALKYRHLNYNKALLAIFDQEKKGDLFIIQPQKPVQISRVETNPIKLENLYNDGYQDAKRLYNDLLEFINK